MKTRMGMVTCTVIIALVACSLLTGCKGGESKRAEVGFHVQGVRLAIDRVKKEAARNPRDTYGMRIATDGLSRALEGLPERIEKKASSRVQERKAAAEEAIKLFEKLKPTLEGLQFDQAKVEAEFAELNKLLDEVEKP
jgi:hypothetical protein